MFSVKIIGAGSIGNHLAHACTNEGWAVSVVDIDEEALARMEKDIYPSRYGSWNSNIKLGTPDEIQGDFDLVIIGTPPDTHVKVALMELENNSPKMIMIEKPLCTPELEDIDKLQSLADSKGTKITVAYNHTLTPNTVFAEKLIADGLIGKPTNLSVQWLEHWGGIFNAHPWLAGPHDSYLGFSSRGGGATGEHSHCLSIFLHFANVLKLGRPTDINATMSFVENDKVSYDSNSNIAIQTESGVLCTVQTDVLTNPAKKHVRIQGEDGFIEWYANYKNGQDAVLYAGKDGVVKEEIINKTRPDDFKNEIVHVGEILSGNVNADESPISFKMGLDTMVLVKKAYESAKNNTVVKF